jgi:Uma2 family endonuclease
MSTGLAVSPMTAEQFADWVRRPENAGRFFELDRGEVIELPPPTRPHGVVCSNVAWVLGGYVRQTGIGYVTTNDSGVILARKPDTVRGPDVAIYADAATFEELHPKYGEVPPLLAVEVLSPEDRPNRVLSKVASYLAAGVRVVWLIDPEDRTVTVHLPGQPPASVDPDGELTGGDVLPGFTCRISEFFVVPVRKT